MRLFTGYIENYNTSSKKIYAGIINSYSPTSADVIILCASPTGLGGSADDINVWVEWDNVNNSWDVHTSDTNYTGDIAFHVITP